MQRGRGEGWQGLDAQTDNAAEGTAWEPQKERLGQGARAFSSRSLIVGRRLGADRAKSRRRKRGQALIIPREDQTAGKDASPWDVCAELQETNRRLSKNCEGETLKCF